MCGFTWLSGEYILYFCFMQSFWWNARPRTNSTMLIHLGRQDLLVALSCMGFLIMYSVLLTFPCLVIWWGICIYFLEIQQSVSLTPLCMTSWAECGHKCRVSSCLCLLRWFWCGNPDVLWTSLSKFYACVCGFRFFMDVYINHLIVQDVRRFEMCSCGAIGSLICARPWWGLIGFFSFFVESFCIWSIGGWISWFVLRIYLNISLSMRNDIWAY